MPYREIRQACSRLQARCVTSVANGSEQTYSFREHLTPYLPGKASAMEGPPKYVIQPAARKIVARLNLSQNALARRCGVTSGYMSQLLSGKRHPGPVVRQRLLDALPSLGFDDVFMEVE